MDSWTRNFWTYPLAFAFFYIFIVFVMVGSSNAVNLTDGLDGLAIGLMIIASGAMTVLTYFTSNAYFGQYLGLARLPNSQELTIFCASMVGASLAFLWYNCHPAEVFMGDVGSLALGGGLGIVAVLIKQEILLIFIGGIYVIEALSVILQVGSYKLRHGKRIFKMAPIHHHFEALGWSESKVIVRFLDRWPRHGAVCPDHTETEITMLDFTDSYVVVIGGKRSGQAAAELLQNQGAFVRAMDSNPLSEEDQEIFDELEVEVVAQDESQPSPRWPRAPLHRPFAPVFHLICPCLLRHANAVFPRLAKSNWPLIFCSAP